MKLFIYSNDSQNNYVLNTKHIVDIIQNNLSSIPLLSEYTCNKVFGHSLYVGSPLDADYILSLGGDGTVLKAALLAIKYNKPLIGINTGRLGYLCACNYEDFDKIDISTFNSFPKSTRSLISISYQNKEYVAINDIIIIKGNPGRTIELNVYCNNILKSYIRGDGVCIATPTGSSAYNLSCGGSIINANVDAFAVSPICAHLSNATPMVVAGSDNISIDIINANLNDAIILCDGEKIGTLDLNTKRIEIRKAKESFVLLTKK